MSQVPEKLTAQVKGSFAYATIKDRLPVTVTKTIDYIARNHKELMERYTDAGADEDSKRVMERLSELRYEMMTDKLMREVTDSGDDAALWNQSIKDLHNQVGVDNATWFKGPWLFAECYLYRRIRESLLLCTSSFRDYDPFEFSKHESHQANMKSLFQLISAVCPLNFADEAQNKDLLDRRFLIIMEAALWANKNDLSLSSGDDVSSKLHNLVEVLDSFRENILCDNTNDLWRFLLELKENKNGAKRRIDIVLDNSSIELASDMLLVDFLLRNEFVDEIRLHGKNYYWFISDVTRHDFDIFLRSVGSSNSIVMNKFRQRFEAYIDSGKLVLDFSNSFWTTAYSFDEMSRVAPELYADLSQNSHLVILKGDLNYRKLLGDLNWPFETELRTAVRGFLPTNLCAIRTLKADLVAGLDTKSDRYIKMKLSYPDTNKWMITGDYGLIQFVKK